YPPHFRIPDPAPTPTYTLSLHDALPISALSDQRAFGGKLGRTLVDLGYVSEEQLVHALATQLGLQTVDLGEAEIGRDALSVVPRSEEHTSELQSLAYLVCRLLLEKKKTR